MDDNKSRIVASEIIQRGESKNLASLETSVKNLEDTVKLHRVELKQDMDKIEKKIDRLLSRRRR